MIVFLYTGNEQTKNEIQKTITFTIELKRVKYLGIDLTKEVQNLYSENYETLLKQIKDDANRRSGVPSRT